jgi:pimeloyl-ACP methyl ester carboxylesterase
MPAGPAPLLIAGAVVLVLALLLTIALLVFTHHQARMLLTPIRKPLELRPADVGLTLADIWIPSPRGRLAAWYLPARNGCTLICCHGINDNRGQWLAQVARLHRERGYGALLFDFSGHGQSEGSQVTYGARERQDVAAVLAYLRQRGDVDMRGIGIMGYSLGAITTVLAAAAEPDLRAVVIESGFADLQRDIGAAFHRFTGLPAFPFANLVVFWGQRIAKVRLSEIRPARIIGQIAPRAVFVISDLADSLVDEPYDGEQLYGHAGEPRRFWQVPGAQHVQAFNLVPDEWIARVEDFFDTYLAPRVAPADSLSVPSGDGDGPRDG